MKSSEALAVEVKIDLYKGWVDTEEAIDFFLNLVLELKALQRQPDPPRDLFVHVTIDGEDLTDEQIENVAVTLQSLY